jgi:hypothetical protein
MKRQRRQIAKQPIRGDFFIDILFLPYALSL